MNNVFKNMTLDELLEFESDYNIKTDAEGEEYGAWYKIDMYKEILMKAESDPNIGDQFIQEYCRNKLLKELLLYGTELKSADSGSEIEAQLTLKEVLKYDNEIGMAYYRLGFIYYRKSNFPLAAVNLKKALDNAQCKFKFGCLTEREIYYAQTYLIQAKLHLIQKEQEKYDKYPFKEEYPDLPNYGKFNTARFILETDEILKNHAYTIQTSVSPVEYASFDDACDYLEEMQGHLILSFIYPTPELIYNGKIVKMTLQQGRQLLYFMDRTKPISLGTMNNMIDYFNSDVLKADTFRKAIERLRNKIGELGLSGKEVIIEPNQQGVSGYYFLNSIPHAIIYPTESKATYFLH